MQRRRPRWTSLAAACVWLCAGCLPPKSNAQRLMDAAQELNQATRFGQMAVATERVRGTTQSAFLERRSRWGNNIRVVDISITGMNETSPDDAEVLVSVAWTRMDEGMLRNTTLRQSWINETPGGWLLVRERRESGDQGLLGEVVAPAAQARPDVHFKSRTLGRPL